MTLASSNGIMEPNAKVERAKKRIDWKLVDIFAKINGFETWWGVQPPVLYVPNCDDKSSNARTKQREVNFID